MKIETYKLYSRAFWIFLPNIIKIYPYYFELYRCKVGPFFWDTVYFQGTSENILILRRVLRPRHICDIYDLFAPFINLLTYLHLTSEEVGPVYSVN